MTFPPESPSNTISSYLSRIQSLFRVDPSLPRKSQLIVGSPTEAAILFFKLLMFFLLWRWRTKKHKEKERREMDERSPLPADPCTTTPGINERKEVANKGCGMAGEEDEAWAIPMVLPGGPASSFWSTNNPLMVTPLSLNGRGHAGEGSLGPVNQLSTRRSMAPNNGPAAHPDGARLSHR